MMAVLMMLIKVNAQTKCLNFIFQFIYFVVKTEKKILMTILGANPIVDGDVSKVGKV
jgi:hypothetical protein